VEKKDKAIAFLNQQKKLQKAEITKQNLVRNVVLFSLLFLVAFIFLLYNRRQLKQKAGYEIKLNQQQNDLFNAVITAQDNEHKRIAQDIHDSLGSVLSAVKLNLSGIEENETASFSDKQEKLKTTLILLDEASAELRNISHNIMPAPLSKMGLDVALQSLLDAVSLQTGLEINYSTHGFEKRINEIAEMSIYRIVQELVNNVIKHAEASQLSIQVIKYKDYINIVAEDNGRGFDYPSVFQQRKGIGLSNILSRVEYLKGTIDIDSKKDRGTMVIIDIPVS
jgi:two-component system, NarL family, sensor kinase